MLNIALLFTAGLVILGIARYNKSNKLFWQLLMATLLGFVAGHVGSAYSSAESNKSTKEVVASAPSIAYTGIAFEEVANICNQEIRPLINKSKTSFRDNVLDTTSRVLTYNPDDDIGQKPRPYDTS